MFVADADSLYARINMFVADADSCTFCPMARRAHFKKLVGFRKWADDLGP